MTTPPTNPSLAATPLLAGVLALLEKISSEHERAKTSKEPRGMIRALTADEVLEAKRLHDALKPANVENQAREPQTLNAPAAP